MRTPLCGRILRGVVTTAFLLTGTSGRAADVADAQTSWQGVERVIAFADVHGAYGDLALLLQKAGVVDRELHWSATTTHVVSLGDLFDRGGESRQVVELMMRLQGEATAAGGQLHVVLGNHEAMNLLGDLRYVTREEYASYATDEPAGEREKQRARFLQIEPLSAGASRDRSRHSTARGGLGKGVSCEGHRRHHVPLCARHRVIRYRPASAIRRGGQQRRAWQEVFAAYAGPIVYEIRGLNVTTHGELTFVHSLNLVSGTLAGGHSSDLWLRWTACFRRIDGVWLVVHDHVSVPADIEHGRAVLDLTP